MATIEFTAFPRATEGRGASRRMRRTGKAPGIVYGGTTPPQPIELDHNALIHALRNEVFHASILTMKVDGASDAGAAARRADASVPQRGAARRLPARSTRRARST